MNAAAGGQGGLGGAGFLGSGGNGGDDSSHFVGNGGAGFGGNGGAGGAGGVSVPPTVTPISTIVAPASTMNCSTAFSASVVFVVPNGSTHADGT